MGEIDLAYYFLNSFMDKHQHTLLHNKLILGN